LKNLPTDLLRTFVTIVKEGGFSNAGRKLGRSQPAISLQMNRLEDLVDKPIMYRDGRSFKLTEDGEVLMDYSKRILRLNDEALLRLSKPDVVGKVRLGIPHEFAISYLPDFLTGFAEAYPGVELEVISELSSQLLKRQLQGELDLVLAIHKEINVVPSSQGWYEKLVWVTDSKHFKSHYEQVPLVVAPQGCVYRHRILDTLDSHSIPWRIVYTGTSYGGICAAVTAGLGVTVLAQNTVPVELQTHNSTAQLPELAGATVELHYDKIGTEPAVLQLAQYIQKVSRQILTG
jgi:DNA-binding transcriptional LysR family regulator